MVLFDYMQDDHVQLNRRNRARVEGEQVFIPKWDSTSPHVLSFHEKQKHNLLQLQPKKYVGAHSPNILQVQAPDPEVVRHMVQERVPTERDHEITEGLTHQGKKHTTIQDSTLLKVVVLFFVVAAWIGGPHVSDSMSYFNDTEAGDNQFGATLVDLIVDYDMLQCQYIEPGGRAWFNASLDVESGREMQLAGHVEFISGNPEMCGALYMRVKRDGEQVYWGPLMEFEVEGLEPGGEWFFELKYPAEAGIAGHDYQSLLNLDGFGSGSISLPSFSGGSTTGSTTGSLRDRFTWFPDGSHTPPPSPLHKECNVDLVFEAYCAYMPDSGGFTDIERIPIRLQQGDTCLNCNPDPDPCSDCCDTCGSGHDDEDDEHENNGQGKGPATPATPATPAQPGTPGTPATPAIPAIPAIPASQNSNSSSASLTSYEEQKQPEKLVEEVEEEQEETENADTDEEDENNDEEPSSDEDTEEEELEDRIGDIRGRLDERLSGLGRR